VIKISKQLMFTNPHNKKDVTPQSKLGGFGKMESKRRPKRRDQPQAQLGLIISACPVQTAVSSLMNSSMESKTGIVFDADVLKLARGMFPPGKEYRFDMFAASALGTVGSGALLNTLPFSPSVTTFSEWTALSALFEEVMLLRVSASFQPYSAASGIAAFGAVVAPNPNNISSAPLSYTAVGRLPHSVALTRSIADLSGVQSITYHRKHGDLPWAQTSTPAVLSPPSGCLGSFDVAFSANATPSTVYYWVAMYETVVLRNRS
jgi:hypothetical protein